jgi:hypothetical protein
MSQNKSRPLAKWDDPMCKCDNCHRPKAAHTTREAKNCLQALSMKA